MTGLLLAPVAPALSLLLSEPLPPLLWALAYLAMLYVMSLLFVLMLGLATLFLLARLNILRWWVVLAAGFLSAGLIPTLLTGRIDPLTTTSFGVRGLLAALLFWICWRAGPEPTAEEAGLWVKSFTRFGQQRDG